jgi:two-component system sensor histidine kinase UhpB
MKITINILLFFILGFQLTAYSQDSGRYSARWNVDSLKKVLRTQNADADKLQTLMHLSRTIAFLYPDSSLVYAREALNMAETLEDKEGIFWATTTMCNASRITGNYPMELEFAFNALSLSKELNKPRITGFGHGVLSDCYYNLGEYDSCLRYWRVVTRVIEQSFPDEMYVAWANLSRIYRAMNQSDSAMIYVKKALEHINRDQSGNKYWHPRQAGLVYAQLATSFAGRGDYDSALYYYRLSMPTAVDNNLEIDLMDVYNGVAAAYKATGELDSAVWYSDKVLAAEVTRSCPVSALAAANLLTGIYELKEQPDSVLKYVRMAIGIKESLFNREKIMAIQNLTYQEREKQKELAAAELAFRNQVIFYCSMAILVGALIVAGIQFKHNRQRQLQRLRNSIADDLHDDIGSTLSSISIMAELAKVRPAEAPALLASIGESTLSMQENMSDIVWAIKSENDHFENVLLRMNAFASGILEAKGIMLNFVADEALSASKLSIGQRKNLYLFFKEAIANVAKHSNAKNVSVRIFQKERYAEMIITDDGVGFDAQETFQGNGMSTLKKRAVELNGFFQIQSRSNEGTCVELTFKIT